MKPKKKGKDFSKKTKSVKPFARKMLRGVQIFSVLGVVMCVELLRMKWIKPEGGSEWCKFGANFNCDIVNQSIYADFFGIEWLPNALMGLLTYLVLFILATMLIRNVNFHKIHAKLSSLIVLKGIFYLSFIGVLFQLYLTYIEAYVLMTWCVLCVASQINIALICLLAWITILKIESESKNSNVCEFC